MEKITDKPDWHRKVFDEIIVERWQQEALAIPDEELFKLATAGKTQYWPNGTESGVILQNDSIVEDKRELEDILDERAFRFVSNWQVGVGGRKLMDDVV